MKASELRSHVTCNACSNKIGHTGLPLFWRVRVERFGVDLRAVRRQDGLAAHMGSAVLANIMGPDEDLAWPLIEPKTLTLCESCAMSPVHLAMLALQDA